MSSPTQAQCAPASTDASAPIHDPAAARFQAEGRRPVLPEIHLRADQDVACRHVAQTLADASKAGLVKVGFVSQPETGAGSR